MQSFRSVYVCTIWKKYKEINILRYDIFKDTYEKKNKMQDLVLLPPCQQTLKLHCQRADYVARVRKFSFRAMIDFADIKHHGWSEDRNIVWTEILSLKMWRPY